MSSSSCMGAPTQSSTSATLPIVQCPQCKVDILRLVSRTDRNPGRTFFKCPNYKKTPTCSFYKWDQDYKQYLIDIGVIVADSDGNWYLVGDSKIEDVIEKKLISKMSNEKGRLVELLVVINTILLICIFLLLVVMVILVSIK